MQIQHLKVISLYAEVEVFNARGYREYFSYDTIVGFISPIGASGASLYFASLDRNWALLLSATVRSFEAILLTHRGHTAVVFNEEGVVRVTFEANATALAFVRAFEAARPPSIPIGTIDAPSVNEESGIVSIDEADDTSPDK